jgi:hypothetical protein
MNATRNLLALVWVVVAVLPTRGVKADFTFGAPANLGPAINGATFDYAARLSQDDLCLFFLGLSGDVATVCMATRTTKDDPWGAAVNLGAVSAAGGPDGLRMPYKSIKVMPSFTTGDGLEIYFGWATSASGADLWMTKRETTEADWGPLVNLGPVVNSSADEDWAAISSDGLELYFAGFRDAAKYVRPVGCGGADLWMTKRATRNAPWSAPVNLGPVVNSAYQDARPYLSADGLTLLFDSQRPGGYGQGDLYMTRRATRSDPWGKPVNLGPLVNTPAFEEAPCLSADGSTLYWDCARPGGYGDHDIWQASIIPIVDFDGDGKVDGKEVLAIAEHWGQNKSLYDIGLSPLGDGVVDTNDLIVLADYIGNDWVDPTLLAHWAMDDSAGSVARDSVGGHDAMIVGKVVWQPAGKVGGALAFDGQGNFVRTLTPVLDPATGPFSLIAWVKGGATNRVIISQSGATDWLYLNQFGMLTTDLKSSGKDGRSLTSDAYLLDDQWHRVAMVWDGTNRSLYADGAEVAKDTQSNLAASNGNLQIGCGKSVAPTTFWSGLIDDVRIYNRAVRP